MLAGRGAGCFGFLRSFKGVRDVLARREAGCCGFLRSFKGVRDVLAGRGAVLLCTTGVMVQTVQNTFGGAADAVLRAGTLMAVCMAMGRLMVFFEDFPHFLRSSELSRS